MTTAASTARPTWAIQCWTDASHIYTEIPATNGGAPYIQKWPLTEGGLSKALAQMKSLYGAQCPLGGDYTIPLNSLIKTVGINNFSQDQRDAAKAVLKKLGIT